MYDKTNLPQDATWQECTSETLRRTLLYHISIEHLGLKKARSISDPSYAVAASQASAQLVDWDRLWQLLKETDEFKAAATIREAPVLLLSLQEILHHALHASRFSPLDSLSVPFDMPRPQEPLLEGLPPEPKPWTPDRAPDRADRAYDPSANASFIRRVFARSRLEAELSERFRSDLAEWENVGKRNQAAAEILAHRRAAAEERNATRMADHERAVGKWSQQKQEHEDQERLNTERLRARIAAHDRDAVEWYFRGVLEHSEYPALFPRKRDLAYIPETRTLLVDFALPAPSAMPTLREALWVKSRQAYSEKHLSSKECSELYDSVL